MSTPRPRTAARVRALRAGSWSVALRPRALAVSACLLLLTALVAVLSLGRGDYSIPVADVLASLLGHGTRVDDLVIWKWRMGRLAVGLVVGAALGMAGGLTQSTARNPLASPDVLGITHGASAAAVFALSFSSSEGMLGRVARTLSEGLGLPLTAVLGALATSGLVWTMAGKDRHSMTRMVLIGIGTSMFLGATITWMLASASLDEASTAQRWLSGSLNGPSWAEAQGPAAALLLALCLAGPLVRGLQAMSLGPVTAHVLGRRIAVDQALQLGAAVLLVATAVSAAGPIGFVAFVAPQAARLLCGTPAPPLAASALAGMLLVTAADLVARTVLPWELPVGIVTAACGAPVLILLVLRMNRKVSV